MVEPADAGLDVLLPVVGRWFRATYGQPTPPQRLGWPAIAAGRNTLIFAPTGSGKTLAAFLACLDHLWKEPRRSPGVRLLYVSPLKALNLDISRNLRGPLEGIVATADREGIPLPGLSVGVRSGDTPPSERQRLVRKPPDLLITTPESLHLMLTSRARETLRSITHVIVDEIHAVCANKRGVFLALLLERLEALTPQPFIRIGLSATQRPLDEVARYLGGVCRVLDNDGRARRESRPVTIVDTGQRKALDLQVVTPLTRGTPPAAGTVWPAIERDLLEQIQTHRSTIIFANNRRVVERLTTHLNELSSDRPLVAAEFECDEDGQASEPDGLARSHHGSLSLEERRATEDALKRGELPAVVATASLELGIDMGAVDLVCQVESPGTVARGLQRVGRAGHVVGKVSKGRLIAKTASDLIEAAALCREMERGAVEALKMPMNCLDVLAQQVVACVAMDRWSVPELFDLVRRASSYRDLTPAAFESVLRMVSGRFPVDAFRDLRPRISWDRVHNTLAPLPGTAKLALVNGGTIPDTGQYPVYLGEDGPRLGELDEEFVLERRVGDTFVLGTSTWRVDTIEAQRVVVSRAEGRSSLMPFWRGESIPRSAELGAAVGALRREVVDRLDDPGLVAWLCQTYRLDANAAAVARDFLVRQQRVGGVVPDDRTVLVEGFRDPSGELGLAVLTPFGGKLHLALKLAFQGRLRERYDIDAACMHDDDGLIFRLPQTDAPPLDLFDGFTSELAESLIRQELGDSSLFGLRFRQSAGRALLMPRPDPGKRSPLWLQRLRAKDLLQVVRRFPDFPIVVETYRECLDDDLDLPFLRNFLDRIHSGEIRVVTRQGEFPSPLLSELQLRFMQNYLYEWDDPKRAPSPTRGSNVDDDLLDPLLAGALWLDPTAIEHVENRLRDHGRPPRTVDEMAERLLRLGDHTPDEITGPMAAFLRELADQNRATRIRIEGTTEPERWINAEESTLYGSAFDRDAPGEALAGIVLRFLRGHALIGIRDLTDRYPISPALATELLERFTDEGGVARVDPGDDEVDTAPRWADARNLAEVRRFSIALKRKESVAVTPEAFVDFTAHRLGVHPVTRRTGSQALTAVLECLQGFATQAEVWETEIFPARLTDFRPSWVDDALASGSWLWRAETDVDSRSEPRVAFWSRDQPLYPISENSTPPVLSELARKVFEVIPPIGACFTADLSRVTGIEPSRLREALAESVERGLVTNDRLDPVRPATRALVDAIQTAVRGQTRGRRLPATLRRSPERPLEGRWSRVPTPATDNGSSELASLWIEVLLERYGVLTREVVALDAWAPPWRILAPLLARMELRGDVRRGYFVEGLSGVQYASHDAAEALSRHAIGSNHHPFMISTLDPANLYGSGAPFDVALLEGGTARLPRSPGNYLVIASGRPVLIVEAHGRRLTGLASASEDEIRAATTLLTRLARPTRRVLKVETYNNAAVLASPAAPWLEAAGFVRDYPGMAYYAGW